MQPQSSEHLFHFGSIKPQNVFKSGLRLDVNSQNFPKLKGIALSYLELEEHGVREPHWHPNANELSYCLEGRALMTIFGPKNTHNTFTIEAGEIVFVPMGSLHHIENIGFGKLKILIAFDNESPEDLNISSTVSVMPPSILGGTFGIESNFFSKLKVSPNPAFITEREGIDKPAHHSIPNLYKYNLEAVNPQIHNAGGWVKLSNGGNILPLEGLAIYSLHLEKNGAREPHWHPNAGELNYLASGTARITLLLPSGTYETFDMKAGDISFMPQGYVHHIENTGNEPAKYVIFFTNIYPSDIGISGSLGAYSNEVLASLFSVRPEVFEALPKIQEDLFIITGAG